MSNTNMHKEGTLGILHSIRELSGLKVRVVGIMESYPVYYYILVQKDNKELFGNGFSVLQVPTSCFHKISDPE